MLQLYTEKKYDFNIEQFSVSFFLTLQKIRVYGENCQL